VGEGGGLDEVADAAVRALATDGRLGRARGGERRGGGREGGEEEEGIYRCRYNVVKDVNLRPRRTGI